MFSKSLLCAGAGTYQIISKTSKWKYVSTWGDDPYDNAMIKKGYDFYRKDKGYVVRNTDVTINKF